MHDFPDFNIDWLIMTKPYGIIAPRNVYINEVFLKLQKLENFSNAFLLQIFGPKKLLVEVVKLKYHKYLSVCDCILMRPNK